MSDKKVDKETDKLTKSMKGLVIGASGNIPGLMHSQIQKMVEKCGAIYTDRNVSKCTHLVTTQAGIKKGLTKVGLAIESGDCHLVNVDWLLKSIENKSPEKVQQYSLLQSKDVKVTDLTDKKRARKSTSVDEDTHPSKKVRDEDQSKLAKLTALVDKSVVMKYKSRKTRSVWMDNSGEIWDATLINSIAHPDKPQETSIVRLQIITQSHCCVRLQTIAQSHYCNYISYEIKREIPDTSAKHTVLHDKKVYRDLNHAKDDFKKRFRELSGLDWKCRNQIPTDDKKHVFVELQLEQPLVLVSENHKLADSVERVLSLIFENGLLDQISNRMSSGGRKMYLMQDSDGYALQAAIALLRKIRVLEGDALKSYDLQVKHLQSLYSVLMMVGQQLKPTKDELLSLDLALKLHTASNIVGQKNLTKALTRSQISHALGLATLTPVDETSVEYAELCKYLHGSTRKVHPCQIKVVGLFRVKRPGEAENFIQWEKKNTSKTGDRRLLWHGSSTINFAGILSQGLHYSGICSASGKAFCSGIYFADMSTKSLGYCQGGKDALLSLCEVELGSSDAGLSQFLMGATIHTKWRDAGCIHEDFVGTQIPDLEVPFTQTQETRLHHSEYVVKDSAQVRLQYLFHVRV